ncbi:MAG: YHS domain-containing (seleno)protein [Spirochaetota bacterium]|nr:YHS domain-containing (seleno)protein [Spirochaetota bacterium]
MKSQKANNMIILSLLLVLFLSPSSLCNIAVGKSHLYPLAIKGYDTVAYFKYGKALQGEESFSIQWHGMIWYFLNKENRNLFAKSPDKYAPQYDGYCAWAMTEARKAQTNPKVWKIVNGRLYLNCSKSAHEKWGRDIPGNIKKADKNWLRFFNNN